MTEKVSALRGGMGEMLLQHNCIGDSVAYFSQYLQAFYQLGLAGLGRHNDRYYIDEIRNSFGQTVMKAIRFSIKITEQKKYLIMYRGEWMNWQ